MSGWVSGRTDWAGITQHIDGVVVLFSKCRQDRDWESLEAVRDGRNRQTLARTAFRFIVISTSGRTVSQCTAAPRCPTSAHTWLPSSSPPNPGFDIASSRYGPNGPFADGCDACLVSGRAAIFAFQTDARWLR